VYPLIKEYKVSNLFIIGINNILRATKIEKNNAFIIKLDFRFYLTVERKSIVL